MISERRKPLSPFWRGGFVFLGRGRATQNGEGQNNFHIFWRKCLGLRQLKSPLKIKALNSACEDKKTWHSFCKTIGSEYINHPFEWVKKGAEMSNTIGDYVLQLNSDWNGLSDIDRGSLQTFLENNRHLKPADAKKKAELIQDVARDGTITAKETQQLKDEFGSSFKNKKQFDAQFGAITGANQNALWKRQFQSLQLNNTIRKGVGHPSWLTDEAVIQGIHEIQAHRTPHQFKARRPPPFQSIGVNPDLPVRALFAGLGLRRTLPGPPVYYLTIKTILTS